MESSVNDQGASAPDESTGSAETHAAEKGASGAFTFDDPTTTAAADDSEAAGVTTDGRANNRYAADYGQPCGSSMVTPPPQASPEPRFGGYGYSALASPNTTDPPPTDRYVCPLGDERWERLHVGQPIPKCSKHGLTLIPFE